MAKKEEKAAASARLGDTGLSQDRPERADGRDDPTGAPHAVEPCRRRVDYDAFGLEDPTVAALEEARMAELRARLAEMEFLSDAERYAFALAETEDEYTNSEPSTPGANGSSNESDCDINRDGPANADDLMGGSVALSSKRRPCERPPNAAFVCWPSRSCRSRR